MLDQNIMRFTRPINRINDAVAGDSSAVFTGLQPRFGGQLGARFWRDANQLVGLVDTTMGNLYGGGFRYVRLSASATAVVVGQIVFIDTLTNAADNLMQVTTAETGSTDGAVLWGGIVLNSGWSVGNYSVIQEIGDVPVKFRATLTAAGATGSRVFCAAAGAGADNGFADVVDSGSAAAISDVSKMTARFLGVAAETPTNGGLKRVYISLHNIKG